MSRIEDKEHVHASSASQHAAEGGSKVKAGNSSSLLAGNSSTSSIFVALNGSDSNPGTEVAPLRTLHKAASLVQPGQTIFVRGGVYAHTPASDVMGTGPVKLDKDATPDARIIVRSYPDELAILDGSQSGVDEDLIQVRGQYYDIVGFELRNAKRTAINLYKWDGPGGRHIRIIGNTIHDSVRGAVYRGEQSEDMHFEGNTVFHNVRVNEDFTVFHHQGGWPSAVNLTPKGDVIVGNRIFENWGEGLGVYGMGHQIRDNQLHDNYGVDIYVSNATDVVVERNFVYSLNLAAYQREYYPAGGNALTHDAAIGISLANENASGPRLSNVRVVNNIVVGPRRVGIQLSAWSGSGPVTFTNSLMAHNTVAVEAAEFAFGIRGSVDVSAGNLGQIVDNIFYQLRMDKPHGRAGTTVPATFAANNWFGGTGKPPILSSPLDVLTNPVLVNDHGMQAADFQLMSASGNVDHAVLVPTVTEDYFRATRPAGAAADIGAHELPVPTP